MWGHSLAVWRQPLPSGTLPLPSGTLPLPSAPVRSSVRHFTPVRLFYFLFFFTSFTVYYNYFFRVGFPYSSMVHVMGVRRKLFDFYLW